MEYYDDKENESADSGGNDVQPQPEGNRYAPQKGKNNMAMFSVVCGVIGLLALCGCVAFPVSIILGVAAITLSIMSKKGQPFKAMAITGLVLGILSLIFGLIECVYIIALNLMMQDPNMMAIFDQMMEQYGTSPTQ